MADAEARGLRWSAREATRRSWTCLLPLREKAAPASELARLDEGARRTPHPILLLRFRAALSRKGRGHTSCACDYRHRGPIYFLLPLREKAAPASKLARLDEGARRTPHPILLLRLRAALSRKGRGLTSCACNHRQPLTHTLSRCRASRPGRLPPF